MIELNMAKFNVKNPQTGEYEPLDGASQAKVQSDWNQTDNSAEDFIKNKPAVYTKTQTDMLLDRKVDKVTGKGLSTNDYTTEEKDKLAGIASGAEVNVQSDWSQSDSSADDYIKNKPTIPTVNDAALTIQKNGTAVGTFSANATTASTINITVPVDAEDVNALPDTTKYGASLSLSIDSSTYVVTASLKDQDGNTLGTAQTIDLPLETVVVGGSYDDTTKKVILTLKNGTTVDFSVADLVAGLQTEITSTNKLDADLVDDTTSVHKFVTAADKSAWNAKSDFSGSYNDLTDKPTIPAAQVNADWNATSGVAQILNKPAIYTKPEVDAALAEKLDKATEATHREIYGLFEDPYLTFTGTDAFNLKTSNGKKWNGTIEYSTDKTTWTEWDGSSSTPISSGANVLYLRGKNNTHISATSGSAYSSFVFTTTGTIACTGDIRTLLDYEDPENTTMDSYCYAYMFSQCKSLAVAPMLPTITLATGCYFCMFDGCISLTVIPELPATMLLDSCYAAMFTGCTSLTAITELPATALADSCYDSMFKGCTSLTVAPELPITTLTTRCYYSMFQDCTSLNVAPALPAVTLADYCYAGMFKGCTSLTTIPRLPAITLTDSCYRSMFQDCKSLAIGPALPATTVANNCYRSMFNGCTSLTTIPALSATTLADFCYTAMFQGCSNIKLSATQTDVYRTPYRIPTSGNGTTGTSSLTGMLVGTGGTVTDTPIINTTYYTSNTVVSAS